MKLKTAEEFLQEDYPELIEGNCLEEAEAVYDTLDKYADHVAIAFSLFISKNGIKSDQDGWWWYRTWQTTDELLAIFKEEQK